jgi:hypothetical protein
MLGRMIKNKNAENSKTFSHSGICIKSHAGSQKLHVSKIMRGDLLEVRHQIRNYYINARGIRYERATFRRCDLLKAFLNFFFWHNRFIDCLLGKRNYNILMLLETQKSRQDGTF